MSNDHTTPDSLRLAILPPLSCHWRVDPNFSLSSTFGCFSFSRGRSSSLAGRRWPRSWCSQGCLRSAEFAAVQLLCVVTSPRAGRAGGPRRGGETEEPMRRPAGRVQWQHLRCAAAVGWRPRTHLFRWWRSCCFAVDNNFCLVSGDALEDLTCLNR
jgi:hypothetical protein